jgi:hypothetical protein
MADVLTENEGREAAARKPGAKAKDKQGTWQGVENVNGCGRQQRKLPQTNRERLRIAAVRKVACGSAIEIV